MDSHQDSDFRQNLQSQIRKEFMDELEKRAEKIKSMERSTITGGKAGVQSLAEWRANGFHVRQLPADEQNILRISIGGGKHLPVSLNYCVFLGERSACIDLLRAALTALESDPA